MIKINQYIMMVIHQYIMMGKCVEPNLTKHAFWLAIFVIFDGYLMDLDLQSDEGGSAMIIDTVCCDSGD